MLTFDTASYCW